MPTDNELTAAGPTGGIARRRRAQGPKSDAIQAVAAGYDPDFARYVDEYIFGEVWGRPGLSQDERMLVALAALAATEHPDQMRNYVWGALHAGMPAEKIREVILMMPVYAGVPATMTALRLWKEIKDRAREQGFDVDDGDGRRDDGGVVS